MNLFADMRSAVMDALERMALDGELPGGLDTAHVTVVPPREESCGELATNAALVLAKAAGLERRIIAQRLAARLGDDRRVAEIEVAGAGFVNLTLQPEVWMEPVRAALREGEGYGQADFGGGDSVNVEFVSANPTGPLHIGHARGAVFGDALAALLAYCGYRVTREYYINDAGGQVDTLARSVHLRYREACGEEVELPDGGYRGAYLVPVGRELSSRVDDSLLRQQESAWLPAVREFAVRSMMEAIRADLSAIGVEMDVFVSERVLQESGRIEQTVQWLADRDLVYEGVLEPPKGVAAEDWKPRKQMLFRATRFGDDSDRPLRKADGAWAYFAPDVAYHADKIERGFRLLIDVWGEDHGGYVSRMKAAVAALSNGRAAFDVKLCRMVRLFRDGKPYKMSKRDGQFVLMRDVLAEIDPDVLRFGLLTRKNDAPMDFDLIRVLEQSRDNPVFYVHYAHARACSAMRKAPEALGTVDLGDLALADSDLSSLQDRSAVALARRIAAWPSVVLAAATAHEPHRISFYLQSLAADLHHLWTAGHSDASLRLIQKGARSESVARLALVRAAAVVIANGLGILGVEPRQEMR